MTQPHGSSRVSPANARDQPDAGPVERPSLASVRHEGPQTQGNDVTVPVELELPGIGSTQLKSLRTEISRSWNG
jgi:hypothetical protein